MSTTINAALSEIRRRAPLYLNSTTRQKIGGDWQDVSFGDEHEFTVSLPAWALRAIVATDTKPTAGTPAKES